MTPASLTGELERLLPGRDWALDLRALTRMVQWACREFFNGSFDSALRVPSVRVGIPDHWSCTRARGALGYCSPDGLSIYLSLRMMVRGGRLVTFDSALHEVVHSMLIQSTGDDSHGPAFRSEARYLSPHIGLPDDTDIDAAYWPTRTP